MGVKASVNRFPIDELTILRAKSAAAFTTDTRSTALPLDRLAAYWNAGEIANTPVLYIGYEVNSAVVTSDETYTLDVQIDDNVSFSTPTTLISRAVTTGSKGVFAIARDDIVKADPAATHIAVLGNVAGTAPSMDFWAYVSVGSQSFA